MTLFPPASPGRTHVPRNSLIIGVLVVASFLALLNETMLVVALPTLAREFAVDVTTAQWVTSGFLLTMAVLLLAARVLKHVATGGPRPPGRAAVPSSPAPRSLVMISHALALALGAARLLGPPSRRTTVIDRPGHPAPDLALSR